MIEVSYDQMYTIDGNEVNVEERERNVQEYLRVIYSSPSHIRVDL